MKLKAKPPQIDIGALLKNVLQSNRYRAQLVLETALKKGNVVSIPVPGKKVFLITHPDDLARILLTDASHYRKSFDYREVLGTFLGEGLLTEDGEMWHRDRRMIQPIFHHHILQRFSQTMVESAQSLVENWLNLPPDSTICLETEMTRLTLEIISKKLLGSNIGNRDEVLKGCFEICQKHMVRRGMALLDISKYLPTPNRIKFNKAVRTLDELIYEIIAQRRHSDSNGALDLLSMLMNAEDPTTGDMLSDKKIRDQFITFLLAGHDTTAMALTWTLYLVSQNKEVESRLSTEISEVLQGETPHFSHLKELKYTKMVLEESMRLYPPAPFFGREALKECELGGFHIPAGSTLIISPYATHRLPAFWESPSQFNPDRFSAENSIERNRFAYFPFGGGPRACIGSQFALMELQLVLSKLVQSFRFELASGSGPKSSPKSDVQPIALISLRPSRSIQMKVIPRTQSLRSRAAMFR